MLIADDDVSMIMEGIFADLLGFEVRRREPAAGSWEGPMLVGTVEITGAWEGSVTVDCPAELAEQTARAMFGSEPENGAEIADALGEVTNMTGGNIKALLPGPSQLSLPAVVEGSNQQVSVPGSSLLTEVAFQCLGLPLKVTVVQRRGGARA